MKKIFVVLAAVALGCTSDSITTPTQESVAGTWTLKSVNGADLPYVLSQVGTSKSEVISDVVTVTPPSTFTELTTVRNTVNGQSSTQEVPDAGTYTLNSAAITFKFNSNGTFGAGFINGKTLTVTAQGVSFVYKKQ